MDLGRWMLAIIFIFCVVMVIFCFGYLIPGASESLCHKQGIDCGTPHSSLITIKEKFNTQSLLDGPYYVVTDYNDSKFQLNTGNSFNDWLSIERGKTYQISWLYWCTTGVCQITEIGPSDEQGTHTVNTSVIYKDPSEFPISIVFDVIIPIIGVIFLMGLFWICYKEMRN